MMRTCEWCGTPLVKGKRRFCSRLCSTRAWRAKNIEHIRALDRANYAVDPQRAMARTLNWRARHPDAARDAAERSRLKTERGVTLDSVRALRHDGLCPICRRPLTSVRAVIDHDHATGLIRGMLCSDCNTGLGMFADNWQRLFCAIQYLTGERTNRDALEMIS